MFEVILEQSEDLYDFCEENFYSLSSESEECQDEFFPHYTYVEESPYPNLEALDVVAVVYLSENSIRGGFTVDFVNCSAGHILRIIKLMLSKANIAIDIIFMTTPEEAEVVRACNIYYHSN